MSDKTQEAANQEMRSAVKAIEAHMAAALAHQPEDEAKCGQHLYDALVYAYNAADLACCKGRGERPAPATVAARRGINAAKLREALKDIGRIVEQIRLLYSDYPYETHLIARKANAALAEPPRNCDVGTAREQEKRHKEEVCPKSACPKYEGFVCNACKGCFAIWSQMPYKKEGEK